MDTTPGDFQSSIDSDIKVSFGLNRKLLSDQDSLLRNLVKSYLLVRPQTAEHRQAAKEALDQLSNASLASINGQERRTDLLRMGFRLKYARNCRWTFSLVLMSQQQNRSKVSKIHCLVTVMKTLSAIVAIIDLIDNVDWSESGVDK